jgi:glycine/D-amino acid oxidase-like deaminating enzyme
VSRRPLSSPATAISIRASSASRSPTGARALGAQIEQRTKVGEIRLRDGRVHEVATDKGVVEREVVVNTAGMYAAQIGCLVGVDIPIIPSAISTSSPSRSIRRWRRSRTIRPPVLTHLVTRLRCAAGSRGEDTGLELVVARARPLLRVRQNVCRLR